MREEGKPAAASTTDASSVAGSSRSGSGEASRRALLRGWSDLGCCRRAVVSIRRGRRGTKQRLSRVQAVVPRTACGVRTGRRPGVACVAEVAKRADQAFQSPSRVRFRREEREERRPVGPTEPMKLCIKLYTERKTYFMFYFMSWKPGGEIFQ